MSTVTRIMKAMCRVVNASLLLQLKRRQKNDEWERTPKIIFHDMAPVEVHHRTGFRDLGSLLLYAAVVCGGNLGQLTRTVSAMTWMEEWVFYFEMMYGRTTIRIGDFAKEYKISEKPLRKVFRDKLKLGVECWKRLPMYATHAEDVALREERWNAHFDPVNGVRIIMHDNTGVPLPEPSDADFQRALYSELLSQNCWQGRDCIAALWMESITRTMHRSN
jgi:hypothetical protein